VKKQRWSGRLLGEDWDSLRSALLNRWDVLAKLREERLAPSEDRELAPVIEREQPACCSDRRSSRVSLPVLLAKRLEPLWNLFGGPLWRLPWFTGSTAFVSLALSESL
jgi:hypothetical protein